MIDNALATVDTSQWDVMKQQAKMLVETGFLPDAIKTPQQAVAIMLKGRELGIPPMYALSNIVVINGKPGCNAELMLALIYRDHGEDAAKWVTKDTNNTVATLAYKRRGWPEYQTMSFTIEDAATAGLAGGPTWKKYPAALLRARCISAVARAVFPDSIGGMYTPEELGAQPEISISPSNGIVTAITDREDPTDEEERINALRAFHAAGNEVGLNHEQLRAFAQKHHPDIESLTELDWQQLSVLADVVKDAVTQNADPVEAAYQVDQEMGEITDGDDLGQSIVDEYLASIYAAKSKSALVKIGEAIGAAGVSSAELRSAYTSRLQELAPKKESLSLAEVAEADVARQRRALVEASGV